MSVLWIANAEVHDPETYKGYAEVASRVIPAHGGVFIARGGEYRQLEGEGRSRNVVIRFPTMEAAVACYEDPEYQAAVEIAKRSAERSIVLVEVTD